MKTKEELQTCEDEADALAVFEHAMTGMPLDPEMPAASAHASSTPPENSGTDTAP